MEENRIFNLNLRHDASMIISGPTQSGKSTFIYELVQARDILFDHPLRDVYWFYGIEQPEFHTQLRKEGIHMKEGLPLEFDAIPSYSMIILDDLGSELKHNQAVTQLLTRGTHHNHCFVILVSQNLFERGKESRTQQLNTQYMVLFKNPRDSLQIRILGSQMYPGKKNYLTSVFSDATQRPHGYLLIDHHQEREEDLRLRTNILPDERPMIVYMPRA